MVANFGRLSQKVVKLFENAISKIYGKPLRRYRKQFLKGRTKERKMIYSSPSFRT